MNDRLSQNIKAKSFVVERPDTNVVFCNTLSDIQIHLGKSPLVLVDKNLMREENINLVCKNAKEMGGTVIELTAGEGIKEYEYYKVIKERLKDDDNDMMFIIGGGTVINLGLYLSSELGIVNNYSPIIIPTNTISFADVAIGSLGLLNKDGIKNKLQVICDPAQIIASKDIFENAPLEMRTDGMIEAVKHALFQDTSILERSLEAFLNKGDESGYFELTAHVMSLKIQLQNAIIDGKKTLNELLTYGHLHAHILEEYFDNTIPHSIAVYVGLLIDLKLAGPQKGFNLLIHSLKNTLFKARLIDLLNKINLSSLKDVYAHQQKHINSEKKTFCLVYLPKLGHYEKLNTEVEMREHTFDEIAQTYSLLKKIIK